MADITKANEQIAAWDKNLEKLKNGDFGAYKMPGEAEKALARYWRAQAEAGYPSADENVRYFESLIETTDADKRDDEITALPSAIWEANHKRSVLDYRWIATELNRQGYRKASDVAREIFAEIENKKIFLKDHAGNIGIVVRLKDIAELKKKYTEEAIDEE